jgi:GNAT superfamily N-acetyltransferase
VPFCNAGIYANLRILMSDELELTDDPALADVDFLDERIYEFNESRTGYRDGRKLAIFKRDERGEIVAGLWGWTWGGYGEIKTLWVHESLRRSGLGTRLLQAAEGEARARGVGYMLVSTHSFQAPDFYPRFGYRRIATVAGKPPGHEDIVFRKDL